MVLKHIRYKCMKCGNVWGNPENTSEKVVVGQMRKSVCLKCGAKEGKVISVEG